MASTKVGKRVLVEMVQSRKKMTVPRDDIQQYHKDLDGALAADEQNIIGQFWQAKPLPPSDWTTGLAACALRGVDMRRPVATQAAHLLQRGRRPRTIKVYESKFERFCSFCEEEQIEPGFEPLCPMPASRATVVLFLGYLQDEDRYTQLRCSHTCLPLIRHTSTSDFQHQQWATTST